MPGARPPAPRPAATGAASAASSAASGAASADAAPPASPPPPTGIDGLLLRRLGERATSFRAVPMPPPDPAQGGDTFEVAAAGGRVELRGTSPVAQACALRFYAAQVCGADVSPDTATITLPSRLPDVRPTRRRTPFTHRTHFNYCTFSYTTVFWDWPQWEHAVDRMALHGVTMPLALTGQEAVWQAVLIRAGMADDDVRAFLGGPGYLPFTWMGCTEQWGGPLPQSWIDFHEDLGRRVIERERELGMTPVLQAFAGHVPAQLGPTAAPMRWFDFSAHLLDPLDPQFAQLGADFVGEQIRRFGTDHVYAADPFIEMVPPVADDAGLAAVARAVHEPMVAADPDAVWLMQSWPFAYRHRFWTPDRVRVFLDAVPDDHMLVQDLWAEQRPLWRETGAFHGKPWVWCMLHNFGGRPGLHGKPGRVGAELLDAAAHPGRGRLSGAGLTMEAEGSDPALYSYVADVLWSERPPGLGAWIRGFALRRYGRELPHAQAAWALLLSTVYAAERTGSPPTSIVVCRPGVGPGLAADEPLHPGSGPPEWDPAVLVEAWRLLLDPTTASLASGRYGRDLADVTAQAVTLHARTLYGRVTDAYAAGDPEALRRAGQEFLDLVGGLDELLATRPEYLLGTWLDAARSWGTTAEERRLYEWNARRLITVWGPAGSRLHDYSARYWSGLVRGYHLPRWTLWIRALTTALDTGAPPDPAAFDAELTAFEEGWIGGGEGGETYPAAPTGDTWAVARRLFVRYGTE